MDIKPDPDSEGFFMCPEGEPPIWFAQIYHAISYAEDVFPIARIRIFASEQVILEILEPRTSA